MLVGMAPKTKIETRPVDVRGREILVKQLNDAQLMLLLREAKLVQKEGVEAGRRLTAIGRLFDILESVVISEDDREYLTDLTVAGDLALSDLLGFINAFATEVEQSKPTVRRARRVSA